MAMKLIKKKAPRGALKRWLSEDEETAIKNFYGRKQVRSAQERELAENVIHEMREKELWLHCSCVGGDTPALNNAKLRYETQTLYWSGHNQAKTPATSCKFASDAN